MIFRIERSSDPLRNAPKPCQKAIEKTEMLTKKVKIHDENGNMIWQEFGFESKYWEIEINTLDDLLALKKEVSYDLIICDDGIEIYDSYRE